MGYNHQQQKEKEHTVQTPVHKTEIHHGRKDCDEKTTVKTHQHVYTKPEKPVKVSHKVTNHPAPATPVAPVSHVIPAAHVVAVAQPTPAAPALVSTPVYSPTPTPAVVTTPPPTPTPVAKTLATPVAPASLPVTGPSGGSMAIIVALIVTGAVMWYRHRKVGLR